MFSKYILPKNFNKREIFKEISNTLSEYLKCYDIIIIAGDLNINLLDPSNLKNLVKKPTSFMSDKGSDKNFVFTN